MAATASAPGRRAYDRGMPLRIHNTLTRRVEEFIPRRPPEVTIYACGPTVYDYAHIGNLSSYLFYDVVRRWLAHKGYRSASSRT